MTKPQFSYNRLLSGKAIVTCTCGWRDPLGPLPVSPFDPAEALAAAGAEHLQCETQPAPITELTTIGELAAQRALLGVSAMLWFASPDGPQRQVVAQHPKHGSFMGSGETEAQAVEDAFSKLRRATLPPALKLIVDGPEPDKP